MDLSRISNLTGKAIPEDLPFLEFDLRIKCDECGQYKLVYNCPFCAAPICCHGCICPSLAKYKEEKSI